MKLDDLIIAPKIPGEVFEEIATNVDLDQTSLYRLIVDVLLDKSFGGEVQPLRQRLLEIMPEMDRQLLLSNSQTRSLKIVLDIAKLNKVNRELEGRLVFEAAFIILMYIHIIRKTDIMVNPPDIKFYHTYAEIYAMFGRNKEFAGLDLGELEQRKLLYFANIMKVALHLMQKPKKAHLLDLVTRICEGRLVKYITGSGQTVLTARRVQIFQYESGVKPTPRPPRRIKSEFGNDDRLSTFLGVIRKNNIFGRDKKDHHNQHHHNRISSSYKHQLSDPLSTADTSSDGEDNLDDMVFEASNILSSLSYKPGNHHSSAVTIKVEDHIPSNDLQVLSDVAVPYHTSSLSEKSSSYLCIQLQQPSLHHTLSSNDISSSLLHDLSPTMMYFSDDVDPCSPVLPTYYPTQPSSSSRQHDSGRPHKQQRIMQESMLIQ